MTDDYVQPTQVLETPDVCDDKWWRGLADEVDRKYRAWCKRRGLPEVVEWKYSDVYRRAEGGDTDA